MSPVDAEGLLAGPDVVVCRSCGLPPEDNKGQRAARGGRSVRKLFPDRES